MLNVVCAAAGRGQLLRARLALALAIIRSTPPGLSPRQFTEALSLRMRSEERDWRRRAEELEEELLRLRQQRLLVRAAGGQSEESAPHRDPHHDSPWPGGSRPGLGGPGAASTRWAGEAELGWLTSPVCLCAGCSRYNRKD